MMRIAVSKSWCMANGFQSLVLEKGRGYPVGTVREWKGRKYIKTAPGKWKPKTDGGQPQAAEHVKLATKRDIDEANAECGKFEVSMEEMRNKPYEEIKKYANSRAVDFDGGIDKFIELMREKRPGISNREAGREFAKVVTRSVARKLVEQKVNGWLTVGNDGKLKFADGKEEALSADSVKQGALNDTEHVKLVNKLNGDVYENWKTDPAKFARYAKDGKATGLAVSKDIADIINSHNEASTLDWLDACADEISTKYPNIQADYVRENLRTLRIGYRNGKKEKVLLLPEQQSAASDKDKPSGRKVTARGLMSLNNKLWDKLGVESGSELRGDAGKFRKFLDAIKKELDKRGVSSASMKTFDRLEEDNYHTMNLALGLLGLYGDEVREKMEGIAAGTVKGWKKPTLKSLVNALKERIGAVRKSVEDSGNELEVFKKKVLEHLESLAGGEPVRKSLLVIEKGGRGLPVGTVREWKGQKYVKVAPGKWKPKYDTETKGARQTIAQLHKKVEACKSMDELLELIVANKDRFSDERGRPLPFVKELSDHVSRKHKELKGGKKAPTQEEKLAEVNANLGAIQNILTKPSDSGADRKEVARRLMSGRDGRIDRPIAEDSTEKKASLKGEVKSWIVDLARKIGLDIAGYRHKTTKDFENHVIKKHGNKKIESSRGQVAVTQDDLDRIGNVMDSPDIAVAGIRKNGQDRIVLVKNDEHGSVLVEEVLSGRRNKTLNAKTFWILDKTIDEDRIKRILANTKGYDTSKIKTATPAAANSALSPSGTDGGGRNSTGKDDGVHGVTPHGEQKPQPDSSIPQSGEKSSGIAGIRGKYEASRSVTGNRKTLHVGEEKIKCHYKLVEADAPTASHDETTFRKTEGFPTVNGGSVNDNDYENSREAQESVMRIAGGYDGRALENPPVVTKDGIVVSGNNRTMSSKLAAKKGTDKAYVEELKETIEDYGIDEEELSKFKNPRLILEIDAEHEGEYTTEEFAKYNRSGKKEKSVTEKAVVIAKTVRPEAVADIAGKISEFETLGELYNDRSASEALINSFIQNGMIQPEEAAQYRDGNGLSANGKEFIETVLVGSVLNEGNIRALAGDGGKAIRQKLVRGIVPLIENKGHGNEYSFNGELNKAVEIAALVSKSHDTFPTMKDYLDQQDMFGEKPDPLTARLAELVHDSTQKAFAEAMREAEGGLRPAANGEMDMFLGGCESRDSTLQRILKFGKSVAKSLRVMVAEAWASVA